MNRQFLRSIIVNIATLSVSSLTGALAKQHIPDPENTFQKVAFPIAGFVLGGIIGEAATGYVERTFDKTAGAIDELRVTLK